MIESGLHWGCVCVGGVDLHWQISIQRPSPESWRIKVDLVYVLKSYILFLYTEGCMMRIDCRSCVGRFIAWGVLGALTHNAQRGHWEIKVLFLIYTPPTAGAG